MNLPLPLDLASTAVRSIIVLVVLTVGIRRFGNRGMGDLNLYDILMVLLIGNTVQNALTHGSGNLLVGLVSAGVLLMSDWLIGRLFAWAPNIEKAFTGEPTIIFCDGRLDQRAMRRQGVEKEEVLAAVHELGLAGLDQVHLAVLETDGTISVIPKSKVESSSK